MNVQLTMSDSVIESKKTPLFHKILVVSVMMVLMGGTLTGVMTYMNAGYSSTFFFNWLRSFLTAAVVVMPAGFFIMVLMTKLTEAVLPNLDEKGRNIAVGFMMALIMESGMAFVTTLNNIGLSNFDTFLSAWLHAVLGALPVALVLMTFVSITIKPKVEKLLRS
ncbi:DUF2798 domain-containing protein [Vibrio sp. F74]|uniref:DUF2798 domain-containing protein n=1 Tax=Vibrio sp. F74 TaxID=700020 RepID=UPI0035F59412